MEIKLNTKILPDLEDIAIDCEGVASTLMLMEDLISSGSPKFENYLSAIIILRKKAEEIANAVIDAHNTLAQIDLTAAYGKNEAEAHS